MTRTLRLLLVLGLSALATGALLAAGLVFTGGAPTFTASAPPTFPNCLGCHDQFALNAGSGSFSISGAPAAYTPGATYTLTLTLQDANQEQWGFELTALDDSDTTIGSFTITQPSLTQLLTSGSREFVTQTSAGSYNGTVSGPVTWEVDWTAPAGGSGTAFFYASGLSCDGSGTQGDYCYSAATASAEAGTGAVATVVLQPETAEPRVGSTWNVEARVRNNLGTAQNALLVSRVRLPNGTTYPPSGFLAGPFNVSLPAAGQVDFSLSHVIPGNAPLITATYEALVGVAPATLYDLETFSFTVKP